MMKFSTNLRDIAAEYDAFIVDLWGVIHDGMQLYPSAAATLAALKAAGKPVLFLSNAPRRSARVIAVLTNLGVERSLYLDAISSGEACWRELTGEGAAFGSHYLYIGPEKDRDLLEGTHYQITEDAAEASFAVATGFDYDASVLEEKMPQLERALAANLPLLCVNPDRIVVRQTGEVALCAGIMADAYMKMGGNVIYYGKPYPKVYEACLEILHAKGLKRIAAIGDSFETDIKGAAGAGLDSILVTGGILTRRLSHAPGILPDAAELAAICDEEGCTPTHVIPAFIW